jgi:hypothetical protein
MIGSSIFSMRYSNGLVNSSRALQLAGSMVVVSMTVSSIVQTNYFGAFDSAQVAYTTSYFMFLLLETAVGIYFPAIGTMRSHVIPESHR